MSSASTRQAQWKIGRCSGVCAGKESIETHNARVLAAFDALRLQAWPYKGAIAIREEQLLHVVDGWGYLGTVLRAMQIDGRIGHLLPFKISRA